MRNKYFIDFKGITGEKAEALYLKAAKASGKGELVRYILEEDDEEDIDNESKVQYNKVFPFYDVFPHSNANELATRWAHKQDVEYGTEALISFNSKWYLIEKVDDDEFCYNIIEDFGTKEYSEIITEYEDETVRDRKKQSIQATIDGDSISNSRGGSFIGAKSGAFGDTVEHGKEDRYFLRLDKDETQRGERSSNDGSRDNEHIREDRQRGNSGGATQKGIKRFTVDYADGYKVTRYRNGSIKVESDVIHDEHDDFGQGLWQLLNSEERKEFVIMETYRDLGFPKVPWNEDYRFVYHRYSYINKNE